MLNRNATKFQQMIQQSTVTKLNEYEVIKNFKEINGLSGKDKDENEQGQKKFTIGKSSIGGDEVI